MNDSARPAATIARPCDGSPIRGSHPNGDRAGIRPRGAGKRLADDRRKALEQAFGEAVGGSAIAVNSCTSALHLGLEALGGRAGDRVLVPTMTFTATAEVVRYLDAIQSSSTSSTAAAWSLPRPSPRRSTATPEAKALVVVHFARASPPGCSRPGRPARESSTSVGTAA